MIRKLWFENMDTATRVEDPNQLTRNPARNESVALPNNSGKLRDGIALEQIHADPIQSHSLVEFPLHTGRPPDIRRAIEDQMGL